MRVVVIGAGAVGCYFGGLLARGGHDVLLVGRPAHVDAIRADGLRLETTTFDERVAVAAATDVAGSCVAGSDLSGSDVAGVDPAGVDVVLVAVKSDDTAGVAAQVAQVAQVIAAGAADSPQGGPLVLSLQNGVDNADRLAALLPGVAVEPAVVYVATEMAGPGHVRHHGRGELVVAPSAVQARPTLVADFAAGGVPVAVGDVRAALWAKLATNCAWNALSAITDRPYGWVVQVAAMPDVLRDVLAECRAVAAADGIALPADLEESVLGLAESMPGQRSSTAQDLARGRRTEIAHLNGYVVRRGAALGVPTPLNRALTAIVVALERVALEQVALERVGLEQVGQD